jgi:hypothetical protein
MSLMILPLNAIPSNGIDCSVLEGTLILAPPTDPYTLRREASQE